MEDEMNVTYSMHRKIRNSCRLFIRTLDGSEHFEDLGVDVSTE
jgi:hypothetical protein